MSPVRADALAAAAATASGGPLDESGAEPAIEPA